MWSGEHRHSNRGTYRVGLNTEATMGPRVPLVGRVVKGTLEIQSPVRRREVYKYDRSGGQMRQKNRRHAFRSRRRFPSDSPLLETKARKEKKKRTVIANGQFYCIFATHPDLLLTTLQFHRYNSVTSGAAESPSWSWFLLLPYSPALLSPYPHSFARRAGRSSHLRH